MPQPSKSRRRAFEIACHKSSRLVGVGIGELSTESKANLSTLLSRTISLPRDRGGLNDRLRGGRSRRILIVCEVLFADLQKIVIEVPVEGRG